MTNDKPAVQPLVIDPPHLPMEQMLQIARQIADAYQQGYEAGWRDARD